jgi:serine/threonine protein kinase
MPYLSHLIPVCLSPERAAPYFRQLCSAVGYLHERGITHNDIKPANVMLSYNDVPVLVDFGFANKWQMGERGSFLSDISWGTPEVRLCDSDCLVASHNHDWPPVR